MTYFYPSQMKAFLQKHNLNSLAHELGSMILGLFVGLYAYEKREQIFGLFGLEGGKPFSFSWPASWLKAENQFYFHVGIVIVLMVVCLKLLLYFRAIDINRLFSSRLSKKKVFDVNGIGQELCTLAISAIVGIFSTPVTQRVGFLGIDFTEKSTYPDPLPGIIVVSICLVLKLFLYSRALNFNAFFYRRRKVRLLNFNKLTVLFSKADWNAPINEFLSLLIGIGIGLYLYQSNMIFLPEQALGPYWKVVTGIGNKAINWGLQQNKEVRSITKIWQQVHGEPPGKPIKVIPDSFSEKEKRPYWIAGLIIVIISIMSKLAMYLGFFTWNGLRDSIFSIPVGKSPPRKRDYNGLVDEILMLSISTILGVLASPILSNLQGHATPYPYGGMGMYLLILLLFCKLAMFLTILDFNGRPVAARKRRRRI